MTVVLSNSAVLPPTLHPLDLFEYEDPPVAKWADYDPEPALMNFISQSY